MAKLIEKLPLNTRGKKYVSKLLAAHDSVCSDIARYNHLWKHFYFFSLLFMIPYNISLLYCIVFGDLKTYMFVGYSTVFVSSAVYVFAIGLSLADIAFQIGLSRGQTLQILIKCRNLLTISNWIKVMNCLERVGSQLRKVGFTCGDFYVVSYATVFKVSILFIYY